MKSIITVASVLFFLTQISFCQTSVEPETVNYASMEFEEYEASFGLIEQGDKPSHVFRFKNTSDVPLLIISAKGSCGCTIPFFPKDPIMPGEMSEIEVEFDSKSKSGKRNQKVSVIANTEPQTTFLYFMGEIALPDPAKVAAEKDEVNKQEAAKEELKSINSSCIALFPNPANEYVQLELKDYIGKSAKVTIYNQMGQELTKKEIYSISRESTRIDVNNFNPGTYVISILVEEQEVVTQCFMIARP